jgi:hypothetical protein
MLYKLNTILLNTLIVTCGLFVLLSLGRLF